MTASRPHSMQPPGDPGETGLLWPVRSGQFAQAVLDAGAAVPQGVGKCGEVAEKRFAVYRNNVVASLIDSLKAAFPSVHKVMGEDNFVKVAGIFCRTSPPTSPMMQHYGAEFPDFLATFAPLAKSPFIAELARIERGWLDAYHALDADIIDASALACLTPEQTLALKFQPHPAASVHRSDFAIADLFDARQSWPQSGFSIARPQAVLITRPGLDVELRRIDLTQALFFRALLDGEDLGGAVGLALEDNREFAPGDAMAIMIAAGLWSSFLHD